MNVPKQAQETSQFGLFVVATEVPHLLAACDYLFVAPADLTWEDKRFGHFLIDAPFEGDAVHELRLAEGVGDYFFRQQLTEFLPHIVPVLSSIMNAVKDRPPDEPEAARVASVIGTAMSASTKVSDAIVQKLLPTIANAVPVFVSWAGARLARAALDFREMQLAATGMSSAQYMSMVEALRELRLAHPLLRVARTPSSPFPEIGLGSLAGLPASAVTHGGVGIEVLRIAPAITKRRIDEDGALPQFIAEFLNNKVIGRRMAYACARFGEQSDPDFDVVIPDLNVGFEVKLVQAQSVKRSANLSNLRSDLKAQLPRYFDAGCEQVFVVTNLPPNMAKEVVDGATSSFDPARRTKVQCVSGRDDLLRVLGQLVERAQEFQGEVLMKEVTGLADSAAKSSAPADEGLAQAESAPPQPGAEDSGAPSNRVA